MRGFFICWLAVLALVACGAVDSLVEEYEQSKAVAAELNDKLGLEPFVAYRWEGRHLEEVSVVFMEVPESVYIADIVEHAQAAIARHFEREPKQVLIVFASDPR